MKMGREHLVPWAPQAVDILRDLDTITGGGRFLFPTISDPQRPMSENTLNAALRRLDFGGMQTAHGFRSIASTHLNEMGISPVIIELQLAHAEANATRDAYN